MQQKKSGGRYAAETPTKPPVESEHEVSVPFETAAQGGSIDLSINGQQGIVHIPTGSKTGPILRVQANTGEWVRLKLRVEPAPPPLTEPFRGDSLPIESIILGDRRRKDMGDLDALADSIRRVGLLHPLVITPDKKLVAGYRRMGAIVKLGWQDAPVRVVANLDSALLVLAAERDENTCRKDVTPSAAVAIGEALEELEKPKAKGRQRAHGGTAPGKPKNTAGKMPEVSAGRTRDKVADAVGMSGRTYQKAKEVVEAAKADPKLQPVVEEMDRTGKVDPAHKKVKEPKAAAVILPAFTPLARAWNKATPGERQELVRVNRATIMAILQELKGEVTA